MEQVKKSRLEMFANEIVAKNKFIKASFGGFAGSGKSRTASEFVAGAYKQLGMTKPILIIDNEKGSRFLIPFFKKELPDTIVRVKDTTTLADVLIAMDLLNTGEIDFLFIDSLSKVWYQYVADYKAKNNKAFMQLDDWGKILPAWQSEFSDKFVNISGSIVFTGRGGFTYEKEEDTIDANGKKKKGSFVKSGVKMKMAGETPFEPDVNIWMSYEEDLSNDGLKVWREAQILKDRSGMIDGMIFKNPSYSDFMPVVTFLNDLPVGEVSGVSDESNLAPSENWDGKNKREQRENTISEIKGLFNLMGLGTSKEDKKTEAWTLQKIFGVTTTEGLSAIKLDTLLSGYDHMKRFSTWYVDYTTICNDEGTKMDGKKVSESLLSMLSENQLNLEPVLNGTPK